MLYQYKDGESYGFINENGKIIIEPFTASISHFSEGLAGVTYTFNSKSFFGKAKKESRFVYIDLTGEIKINNKSIQTGKQFKEGLALVAIKAKDENCWGFINKKGEFVIPPKYYGHYMRGFSEGLSNVCRHDEKYGFIDTRGNEIIPMEYDWTNKFHDGFAVVTKNKRKFFIDKNGEELKTDKCIVIDTINGGFKEKLAVVKLGKKYGAINTNGTFVIDPIFDSMWGFHNGLCATEFNGKWGFINHDGDFIIEPVFLDSRSFSKGVAPVSDKKNSWGLINQNGDFIHESRFEYIMDFQDIYEDNFPKNDDHMLARAEKNRKKYYINTNGDIVAEVEISTKRDALRKEKLLKIAKSISSKKDTWDKAEWAYDGFTITKKGAIKPIYFVLKWLKSKNLLTQEGIACYEDKNNLEIGLYRFMVTEEGADFLDRYYKLWYDTESIANFQIDPSLKFEGDENLTEYWDFYINNKNNIT